MTITIVPRADMQPVPRVELSVAKADLLAGTSSVTLWRITTDRDFKVRGAVRRDVATSLSVVDVEPPLNEAVSYEAECFNSAGRSLGRVPLGGTSVPWGGRTVIQQPLDPHLAVEADLNWGTAGELARSAPGALVYVEGAVLPNIIGASGRRGLEDVSLVVEVSPEDRETLQATLGTYRDQQLPVWLVRSPKGRLPSVFFCHVPVLVESDKTGFGGGVSEYPVRVTEVEPPAPGLVVALLSYTDLDAAYASYAVRDAAYGSYDEMDRDYSLAGIAG